MSQIKLEKAVSLARIVNFIKQGFVSKADFVDAFKKVLDHVDSLVEKQEEILEIKKKEALATFESMVDGESKEVQQALLNKITLEVNAIKKDFEATKTEVLNSIKLALKEQEVGMNFVRDKVRKTPEPTKIDEGKIKDDLLAIISPMIPTKESFVELIPEIPEQIIPEEETPEETRDKLEILEGEERLDWTAIKGLEEEFEKLRKLKMGARGGGVSAIHVASALGKIAQTETPSGAINGSNTSYTVNNTINFIFDFIINGESIHPTEYSVSGKTITMTTALPTELSGTPFTIRYV